MKLPMQKYICIHGHFYQPPRENAWLETVELQDSAYPFHDWNERITAECYGPNTASRILDKEGVIKKIINNYSRISFNFGATLLSWLEDNSPDTYKAILEADKLSLERFSGHGSAIAQVYNHIIMPLANRRDKDIQVKWGLRDFESRFNRKAEGMWLAETAVDTETLEVLAENNVRYTILAPRQAHSVRKIGEKDWHPVGHDTVDSRVPYVCQLPSGKSINIFFYDGHLSQSVAFNGLLNNGHEFANHLLSAFDDSREIELVNIATDGESYGHHHKHGDMALAFCLDRIESDKLANLTNYGEFLDKVAPDMEARIQEESSWSCVHGVGRWKEDCGCHTGGNPGWNQKWRKPLRDTLNWLRDALIQVYEKEASAIMNDPWKAREEYIELILNRRESLSEFENKFQIKEANRTKALRLLEMQRHSLLMFTSCGWFFDEISGIETTQILQYACRAMQLAEQEGNVLLESDFIKNITKAKSNVPKYKTAADIYQAIIVPTRLTLERVGMHFAVASIFEEEPESLPVFNYSAFNEFFEKREAGVQRLAIGSTKVRSKVTHSEKQFKFAVLYLGQQNIIGNIALDMTEAVFDEMYQKLIEAFEVSNLGEMIGIMQRYFGPTKYNLWHLFKDEKRKVLSMIMENSLSQVESSFRRIYNRDYQLINSLKIDSIPIPSAYRTTLQYVVNADLRNALNNSRIDLEELERISDELLKWDLTIDDSLSLENHASAAIFYALKRLKKYYNEIDRLRRLNQFFIYLDSMKLKPVLYQSQNLFFDMYHNESLTEKVSEEWLKEFHELGKRLGIRI
jgi:alpha-amylase/alpha-mannosidase (GH57 family)